MLNLGGFRCLICGEPIGLGLPVAWGGEAGTELKFRCGHKEQHLALLEEILEERRHAPLWKKTLRAFEFIKSHKRKKYSQDGMPIPTSLDKL